MYDPLISAHPGHGEPHTSSYWAASAGDAPEDDGPIRHATEVDVVVIGSGYTGLTAAYFLALEHGIKAVVLEANQVAWGCSGRNGGFARASGGHLWPSELIAQYGKPMALAYFKETCEALKTLKDLIAEGAIDCDAQPDGVIKLAHLPSRMAGLEKEAHLFNEEFDFPVEILSPQALSYYHKGDEVYGGIRLSEGFGLHPMKLAWGYLRMARAAGARVHPASPVVGWERKDGRHLLQTPGGIVSARKVVIATNGYTSPQLHHALRGRYMPVYSQIIVTRPLDSAEVEESLPSSDSMIDTRHLLHYYRRLPDNRIMFGGPGAISGKDAMHPRHKLSLQQALIKKFPALKQVTLEHEWGGWVCMSRDGIPHVYEVLDSPNVYCATGYSGSGVSYTAVAGRRLAAMAAGKPDNPPTPMTQTPPPQFPFARFLRFGQHLAYHLYRYQDAKN